MISSIQGNTSWLPASHSSQVSSSQVSGAEVRGEVENDGDRDDVPRTVRATAPQAFPGYLGNKINALA